jgi:hypothetical protein
MLRQHLRTRQAMNKQINRPHIKGELRDRVAEVVYEWIKSNPRKKIPNIYIAKKFGIANYQVTTVTKYLARTGKIERLSKFMYVISDGRQKYQSPVVEFDGVNLTPPPVKIIEQAKEPAYVGFAMRVTDLAREFHWESNSDSLHEFVEWLAAVER